MTTVDKGIADDIIAGKYDDDNPVKIVYYTNAWGGDAYGVIFEGQSLDNYCPSDFVINPRTYWQRDKRAL